jgi:hypothetical protein
VAAAPTSAPSAPPQFDLIVMEPWLRRELPRMEANPAHALLEPWRDTLSVNSIALGMSPADVVASCSLASPGRIVEQGAGRPLAVGDIARTMVARGALSQERYQQIDNWPPRLDRIECGEAGDSIVAVIAPPPSRPAVTEVHRFLNDLSGNTTFGTFAELSSRLAATFGKPVLEATMHNPDGVARFQGWVFRRTAEEIPCLVKAPAEAGGELLIAGIPSGGPCATYVSARLDVLDDRVYSIHVEMLNPDVVAYTREQYLSSFGLPNVPAAIDYEQFAYNAQAAGFETREEALQRQLWSAISEGLSHAPAAGPDFGGDSASESLRKCQSCNTDCDSYSAAPGICRTGCGGCF